jgi:hypothetical protein
VSFGKRIKGNLPPSVTQPMQYGPHIKVQTAYLNSHQLLLLPLAHTCGLLGDLYDHYPAGAPDWKSSAAAADSIEPSVKVTKQQFITSDVVHFESGLRVEGQFS